MPLLDKYRFVEFVTNTPGHVQYVEKFHVNPSANTADFTSLSKMAALRSTLIFDLYKDFFFFKAQDVFSLIVGYWSLLFGCCLSCLLLYVLCIAFDLQLGVFKEFEGALFIFLFFLTLVGLYLHKTILHQ